MRAAPPLDRAGKYSSLSITSWLRRTTRRGVRVMKSTALFGCLIAACCIGCVAAPASARSGGGGAMGAAGAHGGLRAGGPVFGHGPRPFFARGFAARRGLHFARRQQQFSVPPYWPASYGNFDPF